MKVRDLIAALEAFDPELPVLIPSSNQLEFCEATAAFADVAAPADRPGELHLCDYTNERAVTFVRLGIEADLEERDGWHKPTVC